MIEKKIELFEKHPDIAEEFKYWINNKSYNSKNPIIEQSYTAEDISKLSEYLDGEGAFIYLIKLREEPEETLTRINEGFFMM